MTDYRPDLNPNPNPNPDPNPDPDPDFNPNSDRKPTDPDIGKQDDNSVIIAKLREHKAEQCAVVASGDVSLTPTANLYIVVIDGLLALLGDSGK